MASGCTFPSQDGSFNPGAFGLPFLTQLLGGAQAGGLNPEGLIQQFASLIDDGIVEYTRQMSMKEETAKTEGASTSSAPARETLASRNAKVQTTTKDDKYTVIIPLGADVKAEDLKVSIKDRELIVDVKTESKSEDGTTRLYQEFTKKISLPLEVMVDQVKTVLSPEGILRIEAPLPQADPDKPQPVEIPVRMELN